MQIAAQGLTKACLANLKAAHHFSSACRPEVPCASPSYFPFVEPGGEVDIGCLLCKRWDPKHAHAAACRVCKNTGFIEILGCGMIHPVVFEHVGYDPERYSGFAFGMGVDRIAMSRYGVPHLNMLYGNDPRFLTQL